MSTGRLVLVAGPSGAGKDTLLNAARAHLAGLPQFVFPRRVITRPADATEDHEAVSKAAFDAREFALSWRAHGLCYGIPAGIARDIAAGRVVVVNVSRRVIAEAKLRYPCYAVEITAPLEMLAARLAARGRESAAEVMARLSRAAPDAYADAVILNDGTVEAGAGRLVTLFEALARAEPTGS